MVSLRPLALLPFVALVAACTAAEADDGSAPLETDYLPARTREEAAPSRKLTCEEIDGSKGWSIIVEEQVAAGKKTYAYARLSWSEAEGLCASRCGAAYHLANAAQLSKVRDSDTTSLSIEGITFRGGKKAAAGPGRFWVSAGSFTDPYKFERLPQKGVAESADDALLHAVMCTTTK